MERFKEVVASLLNVGLKDIEVFSVVNIKENPATIDVRFSINKFYRYQVSMVNGLILQHKDEVR